MTAWFLIIIFQVYCRNVWCQGNAKKMSKLRPSIKIFWIIKIVIIMHDQSDHYFGNSGKDASSNCHFIIISLTITHERFHISSSNFFLFIQKQKKQEQKQQCHYINAQYKHQTVVAGNHIRCDNVVIITITTATAGRVTRPETPG